MLLYNCETREELARNDDGDNLDSMLSLQLQNGLYYLNVWCFDDEPDQAYTISIEAE